MGAGIQDRQQVCLECGRNCKNRRALGNHIARSHTDLDGQRGYVLKHFLVGQTPRCMCGCDKEVSWHKLQYRFNDYVNGHNESGFVGFKHTPEQIEKRNKSIRQTYKKNKKDLSARIGEAVSRAFKDPDKNGRLREGQRRGWEDPDRKADLTRRNLEMLEAGIIGPHAPFKTEWKLNPFTGQEEFMHSSWETSFLASCIARGYKVTKAHGITIPYDHPDGSRRIYVPDFYAPDDRVLYEVKGRHDEVDEAKWSAAEEFCRKKGWRFVVFFEEGNIYSP